jgi:hypothetical protein
MDTKAGYLLKINTWENDLDYETTTELNGLTADEVNFYLDIAFLFHKNKNHRPGGYGNSDISSNSDNLYEEIDAIIELAKVKGVTIPKKWVVDPEFDYRVFDSFQVLFSPEPIKDVTETFFR